MPKQKTGRTISNRATVPQSIRKSDKSSMGGAKAQGKGLPTSKMSGSY